MSSLVQLAGAGMICSILLSLGGKGAAKELLRLGCACLFVVLCMKTLHEMNWNTFRWPEYEQNLQETVEKAQQQAQEHLLRETESVLARELERQASAMGLSCTLEVSCTADNSGNVSVEAITAIYRGGNREQLSLFRETVSVQLGIDVSRIIIQEGVP